MRGMRRIISCPGSSSLCTGFTGAEVLSQLTLIYAQPWNRIQTWPPVRTLCSLTLVVVRGSVANSSNQLVLRRGYASW